ncbi:uncharacterized protein LOC141620420 [Silene latifolia]|uniref:uncharacterized protein LOC141620420 n=1 Tax=Silene latifolia TaxID=37657 RepID=UPI003D774797
MARKEVTDGAYTVQKFGLITFMDALNNSSTPKEGIGISGSVPHLVVGNCINMRVTEIATSITFCVSMVYAFNDLNGRKGLGGQLGLFAATIQEPWLVCGDFNCVLSYAERLGGVTCDQEIDDFQGCVSRCNLADAPARGRYSRLDRALINEEWSNCMPDVYAHFLPKGIFDHTPYLLKSKEQVMSLRKPFKYFNMWGKADHHITHLTEWWDHNTQGTKMYKLQKIAENLMSVFWLEKE